MVNQKVKPIFDVRKSTEDEKNLIQNFFNSLIKTFRSSDSEAHLRAISAMLIQEGGA